MNGAFLEDAGRQAVRWRPLDEQTIPFARKGDLPILLVVGLPFGRAGRQFDRQVFSDSNVAAFVNRYFVPVRVDGLEMPLFLRTFLPVSRARLGFIPDFQIWVLEPSGRMFAFLGKTRPDLKIDPARMLTELTALRNQVYALRSGETVDTVYSQLQEEDIASFDSIESPANSSEFEDNILNAVPENGGMHIGQFLRLRPQVWGYLLARDRRLLRKSLRPVLFSRLRDPIDGGFFLRGVYPDLTEVEVDKVAVLNAEVAEVCAREGSIDQDPAFLSAARETANCLLSRFRATEGFYAAQRGDDDRRLRSTVYSLPPSRLADYLKPQGWELLFGPHDLGWAHLELNLSNDQALASLPQKPSDPARLENLLDKIREGTKDLKRNFVSDGYSEVQGLVSARLLTISRLLNDPEITRQCETLADDSLKYLTNKGISHHRSNRSMSPQLGDHLAIADAFLQDFLTFGSVPSLVRSVRIMEQIPSIFDQGGWLGIVPTNDVLGAQWGIREPEVVDNFQESCAARYVRLGLTLSRLLIGQPDGSTVSGVEIGASALSQLATLKLAAGRAGLGAAGFQICAQSVKDDLHAIVVGTNALTVAAQLERRAPWRLVAPAIGPVRPDLQQRPPGIYLVHLGIEVGPVTMQEALKKLARPIGQP
jgi:uncharacterized protein YyaL (SSP411 family)